ncbi:MAG: efflux RND transporter periplasmic adaptor subunit [Planctomycetota bacterium]
MPAQSTNADPKQDSLQQRVQNLAREIEQLAGTGLPPQDFFPPFLDKVVSAVAAQGGAIWLLDNGKLQLCCEVRLKETGLLDSTEIQQFHQRVLGKVASDGETRTTHTDDEPEVTFPLRHLLVLAPLWANGGCKGVVEIFQRPDVPAAARAGYMQFVEQMAGYASMSLDRGHARTSTPVTSNFDNDIARYGLQLQRSLQVRDVAAVAANDGRLLVGCDRVSVILQRGKKIEAEFVSGQETIHRRANLVKSMVRLSREVIKSGVAVKYTGITDSFAPQVKERLTDFVQESGARMVYVLPLRAPTPLVPPESTDDRSPGPGRVIGCLLLEQFAVSEPSRELTERLDLMIAYTAAALHNAQTYQTVFLLPLWRAMGNIINGMHGKKLLKTLAAFAVIAIVTCVLVFVKIDFRVEGEGRLMPVERREVFVPYDGEVIEVLVASGARVNAGDLLVRLRNNELRSEVIATESQRDEKRKLISALLAERDEIIRSPTGERGNRVEGELAKTLVELRGLERKVDVLQERERRLNVTSPIAGVVSTFEVDQLLRHRPVRRGEILLEVMDDTGPWCRSTNTGPDISSKLKRKQPNHCRLSSCWSHRRNVPIAHR